MSKSKPHRDNHPARASALSKAPSRPDDPPTYTVRQIIPEKLLCNTSAEAGNDEPPANPPLNQRIKLTAIVADADGNPPTQSVAVTWRYVDGSVPAGVVWWYPALNQTPTKDQATTNTLTAGPNAGTALIWVAATEKLIGNVAAGTDGQALPGSQLTLAVWDFDGANDLPQPADQQALDIPVFSVGPGSTIPIPDYDLGKPISYNPKYQYADSDPITPDPKIANGSYFIRHWNYKDQKDVILRPPQVFSGGSFQVSIPYQIMNTDERPNANAVTYCFYSVFNPYWSTVFPYSASGTALVAPDVVNNPTTTWLSQVLYVEPDVADGWQDEGADPKIWPTIAKKPEVITKAHFGQKGLLNFAIPLYRDWNKNDQIVITAYLNGYLATGDPHNTTAAPPGSQDPYTVTGADFSPNFSGMGGAEKYALVQFSKSDMGDFEADQLGDNGVMFIQYVLNNTYYSNFFYSQIDINPGGTFEPEPQL